MSGYVAAGYSAIFDSFINGLYPQLCSVYSSWNSEYWTYNPKCCLIHMQGLSLASQLEPVRLSLVQIKGLLSKSFTWRQILELAGNSPNLGLDRQSPEGFVVTWPPEFRFVAGWISRRMQNDCSQSECRRCCNWIPQMVFKAENPGDLWHVSVEWTIHTLGPFWGKVYFESHLQNLSLWLVMPRPPTVFMSRVVWRSDQE